jgi:hypothetical protein
MTGCAGGVSEIERRMKFPPGRYRICPAGILRLNDRNIDLYQNS